MKHRSLGVTSRYRDAFTRIELLVVIAMIAIRAAILFPVFAQAKAAAKKTACLSNVKNIGLGAQIYLADFSGPHRRLLERGLISQEDDQHQYRFIDIVDLESNRPLFAIEHEVRSMRHPLFARPLVNRNPAQTNRHYMPDHDTWRGPFIPD